MSEPFPGYRAEALRSLESAGYVKTGENLWRKPGKVVPGFVKTKDPRDFDGVVPPSIASFEDDGFVHYRFEQ